jgi:2-(1,2-epoxy-1,2-dihydrophenyl)acetyl-CoA isomerase
MSIDLTIDGPVATIVLNRPEKLNALTFEMREGLTSHFARLRYDDAVRAIIVTGAGDAFCSGADVGRMGGQAEGSGGGHDLKGGRERLQRGGHSFIRELHAIEKPVIAAVRGPAVGIGWSIALACDLIVASETARFSQIFRRIGLAPDGGAIWFLTRLIGMARAKELVYSARFVLAPEALALGLVNHVVADGELMTKTQALAADFAAAPTFALGLAKRLFAVAAGPSLEDYLERESFVQPQLQHSRDHQEGVAAFKEKRPPRFTGR